MLIQFSVSNYRSIKEEAVFSALAGSDKLHETSLIHFRKERVLPSIAVYGANAAGKSNLFKAITAALVIIRSSNNRQINEPIPLIAPFAFDDESGSRPTSFNFIFTANGKKYEYGFSADKNKVYDEYLYEYRTAKPSKIFERTNTTDYSFVEALEKEMRMYVGKNTENKLFLSTATAWNCERTKSAYLWLAEAIDTFGGERFEGVVMPELENDKDGKLEKFITDLLREADINITGYQFKVKDIPLNEQPNISLPPGVEVRLPSGIIQKHYEMTSKHMIQQGDEKKEYLLPFGDESEGTKRLFFYSPIIKRAIEKGNTVIIDEIDNSLHPLLTIMLIELFHDKNINKNGAQLLFNTHDVSLLDLEYFRRDQIYFVEKNNLTGVTDLYSLDEFSPRKTENIRKGYLQGRYGAIPAVGFGGLEW